MNQSINKSLLLAITLFVSLYIASCSMNSTAAKCPCSIDTSLSEIDAMKDIVINVDKNKDKQLFHVQPIIKDTAHCKIGIVALIGDMELTDNADSISAITFNLVHESESNYKLQIDSISLANGSNGLEIFKIYTSYQDKDIAQSRVPLIPPRALGENGYRGDIDFLIDGVPSTSIPRICEFVIPK